MCGLRVACLEVGDGTAEITGMIECGAELETELRVGRVLFHALLGFDDLFGEGGRPCGVEGGLEFGVVRIGGSGDFEISHVGLDGAVLHGGGLGGESDVTVAQRVGPGVEGVGIVPVFELFVDVGEVLDGGEVVRIGVVFLDDAVAALLELLAGEAGAGGLFQFLELGGVFHQGAHVGILIPLALLHGSACGGVLGTLDGDAIGGVVLDDVVVNFRCQQRVFADDVELGEAVEGAWRCRDFPYGRSRGAKAAVS